MTSMIIKAALLGAAFVVTGVVLWASTPNATPQDSTKAEQTPGDTIKKPAETPADTTKKSADMPADTTKKPAPPPAVQPSPDKPKGFAGERVLIKTSLGDIVLELNRTKAPITVLNFLNYVDKGFFDSTIFHRVIPKFMIQGGGFTIAMEQKEGNQPIQNEWKNGLKNKRGTIAMARLGGQANSATSQFFINLVDNAGLDQPRDGAGYAVFGIVVEGMDVVDKIALVKTQTVGMYGDVPVEPIVVEKVIRLDKHPERK
jgi:peptidyl-prolyl cis-trans isomerase A (cyclophilin A)